MYLAELVFLAFIFFFLKDPGLQNSGWENKKQFLNSSSGLKDDMHTSTAMPTLSYPLSKIKAYRTNKQKFTNTTQQILSINKLSAKIQRMQLSI